MHPDPESVYELEIDPNVDDDQRVPGGYSTTIEERSVRPSISHVPPADSIIGRIIECIYDNGEYDDDGTGTLDVLDDDEDIVAAAEALRQAIAKKLTWYMAGDVLCEHKLTFDADGEPRLDERLLYRPAGDPGPVATAQEQP